MFPYNLNYLKEYAFSDWTSLTEVEFNSSISVIENYVLSNCPSLKIVNARLAGDLSIIKANAFSGANALDKLNLPAIGYGSLTVEGEIFQNVKNIIYNGIYSNKISAIIGKIYHLQNYIYQMLL